MTQEHSSDQPSVDAMLQMIHAGAIGPCRGVDLQYRSKGSCGWPDLWRVTFIKPDALGATPTVVFAHTPHDALRLLMQTCGYQFESRNLDPESLVEGKFYTVKVVSDPDATEPWENEPMPARYAGNGKWQYLDPEPTDWPVLFARGPISIVGEQSDKTPSISAVPTTEKVDAESDCTLGEGGCVCARFGLTSECNFKKSCLQSK